MSYFPLSLLLHHITLYFTLYFQAIYWPTDNPLTSSYLPCFCTCYFLSLEYFSVSPFLPLLSPHLLFSTEFYWIFSLDTNFFRDCWDSLELIPRASQSVLCLRIWETLQHYIENPITYMIEWYFMILTCIFFSLSFIHTGSWWYKCCSRKWCIRVERKNIPWILLLPKGGEDF